MAPASGKWETRVEQAFLSFTPWPDGALSLSAGKFVSPFGAYNQRHDSVSDPFVRPPLPYDYRTMICSGLIPRTNDGFISWKNRPEEFRPGGAPPIWGNPYLIGAKLSGSLGRFDYRLAVVGAAVSSEPSEWDRVPGREQAPSWVGRAGVRLSPELHVGLSFDRGPYLLTSAAAPDAYGYGGYDVDDYPQTLWGVDVEWNRGHTQLRAEWIHDTWEVPNVLDSPVDTSFFVELSHKPIPGLVAAVRWGRMEFGEVRRSDGTREPWDWTQQRWQAGLGYRFTRFLEARAEYQHNRTAGTLPEPDDDLLAFQVRWEL